MLEVVWHAVGSVLTLCLIVAVGVFLARRGWFGEESRRLLPKLVISVSLPPFLFYTIVTSLTRGELLHFLYGVLVPLGSIVGTFCVSLLLARLLKVETARRGIFYVGCTFSNTIFIGVPVNLALFGESALPYVLLYYFANTVLFWSAGNYLIAASGSRGVEPVFSKATVKQVFSPPMIGFFVGMFVLISGLPMPDFLLSSAKYLGSLTTPLVLISLGVTFYGMRLGGIRLNRELAGILFGRFVVSPLAVLLLSSLVPMPELMRKVFVIQAALPTIASMAVITAYHQGDEKFAAMAVLGTTVLSIVMIPLYMVLVTLL